MTDISKTLEAKSDQLNSDDLIGGAITIKITKVDVDVNREMPVWVHYEGDNGKPFKPCKTVRRILAGAWGVDSKAYIGRSMTLYRDPTVQWGGEEVGGIRVSHMSGLDKAKKFALTARKGGKKNHVTIEPLTVAKVAAPDKALIEAGIAASLAGVDAYTAWLKTLTDEQKLPVKQYHKEWSRVAKEADIITLDDEEPSL